MVSSGLETKTTVSRTTSLLSSMSSVQFDLYQHLCSSVGETNLQGSSERVHYFAERVLNGRSDQKIKNAFLALGTVTAPKTTRQHLGYTSHCSGGSIVR